jgi:hypothetical protein
MIARRCGWCHAVELTDPRATWCGRTCRQAAFRARRRASLEALNDAPGRFCYADPPYPGLARRYYRDQPTYAGEVDHAALIARLETGGYLGWALSTSARALRDVLSLCPADVRVCAWVKPHAIPPKTRGLHNAWEPLIIRGGRQTPPGRADWLRAYAARGGGTLPGRKPLAFCTWMFALLGMRPGDALDDVFPGTGIVSAAWRAVSSGPVRDASPTPAWDASRAALNDASLPGADDTSPGCSDDTSPSAESDA